MFILGRMQKHDVYSNGYFLLQSWFNAFDFVVWWIQYYPTHANIFYRLYTPLFKYLNLADLASIYPKKWTLHSEFYENMLEKCEKCNFFPPTDPIQGDQKVEFENSVKKILSFFGKVTFFSNSFHFYVNRSNPGGPTNILYHSLHTIGVFENLKNLISK